MASELIECSLYNGLYQMVHNPNARGSQPRYKVNDTSKPQGVTTILGNTLSKDLMQWAVDCSTNVLVEKLNEQGHLTEDDLHEANGEYKNRRDSGASTGTEAHLYVEQFLKGQSPTMLTATAEARKAYNAFKSWFTATKPKVIGVENVIYSERYDYAGTYDCLLEVDGKNYLCDLKTTNISRKAPQGVYAEYFIQLGAYASAHEEQRLYEEHNGGTDLVPIEGLMVISAKKNGQMDVITNEDVGLSVSKCAELFQQVVSLNSFLRTTTKKLGGK